jgi:tetratricopeptide (TPR) repeat protein
MIRVYLISVALKKPLKWYIDGLSALDYSNAMRFFKSMRLSLPALGFVIFLGIFPGIFLGACSSGPPYVAPGTSAPKIIQLAQEASDKNRYSRALQYYQMIGARFPDDLQHICAAQYEVAFIHYKRGKYILSKNEFSRLMARYDGPDAALLPPEYRVLSKMILGEIDKKLKHKSYFERFVQFFKGKPKKSPEKV